MTVDYIKAVEDYGSVSQASWVLRIPRTTFRRKLEEQKCANEWAREHVNAPNSTLKTGTRTGKKTALLLFDIHYPHESEENVELAIDYALTKHTVSTVVLGGDIVDCHQISKFSKDPYDLMPIHEEMEYANNRIGEISKRFPGCEKVYIAGNHEIRFQRYLWSQASEISRLKGLTIPEQLDLGLHGFRYIDNLKLKADTGRFYQVGKLSILHGHELGICPMANPGRSYLLKALDNMICGHVHRESKCIERTIGGKVIGAFTAGALCNLNPSYRPNNSWTAGFSLVTYDQDGEFSVKLKTIIGGKVL